MAIIQPTTTFLDPTRKVIKFVWANLANGDSGAPVEYATYNKRSAQVEGTFGAAGSISIEGSNNGGLNYETLNDALGSAVTFAAAAIKTVAELSQYVRPRVTAGDGTTSLTVSLICVSG